MPSVIINDEPVEVDLASITFNEGETPAGFVPAAKVTDLVKSAKAAAKRSLRTELASDDAFFGELAEARGIELREDGTPKGGPKDQKALEERWKAQHLTPLAAQLDEATTAVSRLRERTLEADILAAASAAGVKPSFLKPAPGSKTAPIVTLLKESFAHDAEADTWGVRADGDALRYTTDGKPFGASDLLSEMKTSEDFAGYFASAKMTGAGHGAAGDAPSGRVYTRAEAQAIAADPAAYAEHREELRKAATEGRIRD